MRADRIKPGDILPGFPNRTVTAVERIHEDGWPKPWVRITSESGISHDYPPDWQITIHDRDQADDDLSHL